MTAYPITTEERLSAIGNILDLTKAGTDVGALKSKIRLGDEDLASLLYLLKEANVIEDEKKVGLRITSTGVSLLEQVDHDVKYDEALTIGQVSPYYGDYPSGSGLFCTELINQILLRTNYLVEVFTSRLEGVYAVESNRWLRVHRGTTPRILWNVNPATILSPQILTKHLDLLHVHSYIYITTLQAALTRHLKHTKMVLHLHGGIDGTAMLRSEDRRKIIFKDKVFDKSFGKFVANSSDLVLSTSRRDLFLAQEKWNIPDERIEFIPPAVNTEVFKPSEGYGSKKRLVFLGRLESWKGFKLLMDAVRIVSNEYREIELVVAGTGSQLLEFAVEAHEKDLPIRFLGRVSHHVIPKLLENAYATVMPSYLEGLPLASLESMASGVPVIASNVGDFTEVIINGETGLLVEPDNSHKLADALLTILEDEPLRKKLGSEARDLMVAEFSWNVIFRRIMSAYRRTLEDQFN